MTTAVFKKVDYTLDTLLSGIDMGTIGLPDIQRPFVWKPVRVRDLFDSMYQGFPVGYLLFWANNMADSTKTIGLGPKQKVPSLLIVDGQQRLTSLYSVLRGKPVLTADYQEHRIQIAFNPGTETFATTDAAVRNDPEFIPDISELWSGEEGEYAFVGNFLENLAKHRELSKNDEKLLAERISRLNELEKYPFTALELVATLPEDKVADVFVRINSEGITLKQADFILTLMSVYWEEGRRALEDFCRKAETPAAATSASPYNHFIEPAADQLLRVSVGLAFFRGRLQHVYTLLRGKDMETGEISEEIRDRQFKALEEAQAKVLDLTNWHEFHKALLAAGYASGDVISSENAIMYTYILFLVGRFHCSVPHARLRTLIARWFFMATLTGRYTNSPESAIEQDLSRLRDAKTADGFASVLESEIGATLTNDYWEIQLPNALATSAARGPSLFAYYAALRLLDAHVLFSNLKVGELLDPAIKSTRSALERHHLFPRDYLAKIGVSRLTDVNQIANFTLLEWSDNGQISGSAPSEYVPAYEGLVTKSLGTNALDEQYRCHALPSHWYDMEYHSFLTARRKLMAATVRRGFESIARGAATAPVVEPRVRDLIALGESSRVEFKSSARWNVHSGGQDSRLETKILTTLAGFMNGGGGTLLIGVADDGAVLGLENDYSLVHRSDQDGWRSWFSDLVAAGLGKPNLANVRVEFEPVDGKDVCRVTVRPAIRPVWLQTTTPHEFYTRFDNSTRQLVGSEILDYADQRWGEGSLSSSPAADAVAV